jgi:hypothetical protein
MEPNMRKKTVLSVVEKRQRKMGKIAANRDIYA